MLVAVWGLHFIGLHNIREKSAPHEESQEIAFHMNDRCIRICTCTMLVENMACLIFCQIVQQGPSCTCPQWHTFFAMSYGL